MTLRGCLTKAERTLAEHGQAVEVLAMHLHLHLPAGTVEGRMRLACNGIDRVAS